MSYLSQPALSKTHLYFITEEDLWSIPFADANGVATRLTAGLGPMASPCVSPDGNWIAVASEEEGHCEVYLIPSEGGELKRLTYFGGWSYPIAWKDSHTLVFKSNAKHPHRMQEFFEVPVKGGIPLPLRFGEGTSIDYSTQAFTGRIVIERNMHRPDPAHWKRYRGGTMGQLWVSTLTRPTFQKLESLKGNISCPKWVGSRIFFLSDETGFSRLYSCDEFGVDLEKHCAKFQSDYYFRNLCTNGELLSFQLAGDLYLYVAASDQVQKINPKIVSDHSKAKRKNISAQFNFEDYSLQPQGEKILIETRGKILIGGHWSGPISQIGNESEIRYKSADWLSDGKRVVVVRDDGLQESIQMFTDRGLLLKSFAAGSDFPEGFGRISQVRTSPRSDEILIINHRNELIFLDLNSSKCALIHRNEFQLMEGGAWSPDGRYVAFVHANRLRASQIAVWDKETKQTHFVTEGTFEDYSPHFDPEGKYLYFLSKRIFNPIYDDAIFDMTFAKSGLPMLIVLDKNNSSPFLQASTLPDQLAKIPHVNPAFETANCKIDFDGITDRILQFPVLEARYTKIVGLGRKVLWTYAPVDGAISPDIPPSTTGNEFLDCFDFLTGKFEYFGGGVTRFHVRHECGLRAVRSGNLLRLAKAGDKPEDLAGKLDAGPKSGIVDLSRMNVMVHPQGEWTQMFKDAWRQQKEFFWHPDLKGIDWNLIFRRYEPIVQKVSCRREFADVIWELLGELGTSHAYERGGDYRGVPSFPVGSLGADFLWQASKNAYEITKIYRGDLWSQGAYSPLLIPGVALQVGDFLQSIAGMELSESITPMSACLNLAGREVWIRYQRKNSAASEDALIRLLKNDQPLLYRNWVEEKRAMVKTLSHGKLGYIHIPNMLGLGFAEFHRNFLQEVDCEGLIIDVRYNGGGHVSQLILDRLSRKPIGRSDSRWLGSRSVPYETPRKVVVAVCNEFAGSDGDIFSHTFKLRKIGTLVGTRTWGGVVGIWPRNFAMDGGSTTQPEFSTWFSDVGYGLENHGAEPDLVVEFPPDAFREGKDPQLETAIAQAMKDL